MSRIEVYEGSDPLLTLRLKKKLPDFNGTAPYKLDGSPTIVFAVKEDPDLAPIKFSYTGASIVIVDDGTGASDKYSEITVQCIATDLTPPGVYYWHLSVTKASKKDIVGSDLFEILNI